MTYERDPRTLPTKTQQIIDNAHNPNAPVFEPPEANLYGCYRWENDKVDRNARVGILTYSAFLRTLSTNPQEYLYRSSKSPNYYSDPFQSRAVTKHIYTEALDDIRAKLKNIAELDFDREMNYISSLPSDAPQAWLKPIYHGLALTAAGIVGSGRIDPNRSSQNGKTTGAEVNRFTSRGIGTAVKTLKQTSEVGIELWEKKFGVLPSPKDLGTTVLNSGAIPAQLAAFHLDDLGEVFYEITNHPTNRFERRAFELITLSNGEQQIQFTPFTLIILQDIRKKSQQNEESVATYCPALLPTSIFPDITHHRVSRSPYKNLIAGYTALFADAVTHIELTPTPSSREVSS